MSAKLKLASYNIQDGLYEDLIVDNIHKMVSDGVDIFCLQETRIIKSDFIVERLKKELGNGWRGEYFLGIDNPRTEIGVTILWKSTKLNLQELEKIFLPKLNYVSLYDYFITSFFKPAQRGAMIATFSINGVLLRITNLHLDFKNGTARRMNQVEYLTYHLNKKPTAHHEIIGGDFNTHIPKVTLKERNWIISLLGNEFVDAFPNLEWTFDGASIDPKRVFSGLQKILLSLGIRFYRKLDYIFLKNIKLTDAKMENFKGSDHYPLIITFEV